MLTVVYTLCWLMIVSVCVNVGGVTSPSWRDYDRLRRRNCSECSESLEFNVADVLPRLTLIKQKILHTIDKHPGTRVHSDSKYIQGIDRDDDDHDSYRIHDIVYHSIPEKQDTSGETVLKFGSNNYTTQEAEVLDASLLVFIHRHKQRKKSSKGKRITLEISELKGNNSSSWQPVTILRTRVKRRRWKRISLPVSLGQKLVSERPGSLRLKVTCRGCGRLLKLGLPKTHKGVSKAVHKHQSNEERRERRKRKRKGRKGGKVKRWPLLVIRTREPV